MNLDDRQMVGWLMLEDKHWMMDAGPFFRCKLLMVDISRIAELQICQFPSPAIDWKIWKALYSR